jgi:hypothetical protein
MKLGYAQETITPQLPGPVYLAGFGRNRPAESIADDLWARVLNLQEDENNLFLVALDLIGLGRHQCQKIEREVQQFSPGARVIICCTHTHHGPDTLGFWGPDETTSGVQPEFMAALEKTVVAACREAAQNMQGVTDLQAGSVEVSGVSRNFRDPEIIDAELSALQFNRNGTALAVLAVFPCHPEVLWEHNPVITSDYAHSLRTRLEDAVHAPCMFLVGALGGMLSPDVVDHSFDEARAMGNTLAKAAVDTLAAASPFPSQPQLMSLRQDVFQIPMSNPLFHLGIQIGLLDPALLDASGKLTTETNLVRIGPAWLATVPGEILPKLGLEIKQMLLAAGAHLPIVIGLANDELGYILPAEDFIYPENPLEPGDHYEETMSAGPEAGPRTMASIQRILT